MAGHAVKAARRPRGSRASPDAAHFAGKGARKGVIDTPMRLIAIGRADDGPVGDEEIHMARRKHRAIRAMHAPRRG